MGTFEEILARLVEAPGVSGFEDSVRQVIVSELEPTVDKVRVDRFGNVVGIKDSRTKDTLKVMLTAHMDEIGFIVRFVEKSGFIRFAPMGTWAGQVLLGQRVIIHSKSNARILGVIGAKPPHIMTADERTKTVDLNRMFIDIGANSAESVRKYGIQVGDPITMDRDMRIMVDGRTTTGKALDDRIGCAILVDVMKDLGKDKTNFTIYVVSTTQEEIGLRGASVSPYDLAPDLAICVDVTLAADVPGVEENAQVSRLGYGPVIRFAESLTFPHAFVADPRVRSILIETAIDDKIPYQVDVLEGGLTDAAAISLTGRGVPAGVVSVPCRYVHSPVEIIDLEDAKNCSRLIKGFLRRMPEGYLQAKP